MSTRARARARRAKQVNRLNGAYGDGTVELSPTSFIRDVLLGVLGRRPPHPRHLPDVGE